MTERKMEVQSGVQQPDPCALGSPRSGANQQNEADGGQEDASGRNSTDRKDTQPALQKDDRKPSAAVRGYHSSKTATMSPSLGSSWSSGSGGGQGNWSGPSLNRSSLQHYISHHHQHPHHHSQSTHTSYAYCLAHTSVSTKDF